MNGTSAPWVKAPSDTEPGYDAIWGDIGLIGQVQIALLTSEGTEADERLLTQAPKLFAALKELRKWMPPSGDPEIDAAMKKADDVIAAIEDT